MNLEWQPADPEDADDAAAPLTEPETRPAAPVPTVRVERPGKLGNRLRVFAALLLGGLGGAAIIGPIVANAASPAPTAATAPSTTGTDTDGDNDAGHHGGPGGPGGAGHVEAVSDASVVAKAIGISEADLNTALAGGQTIAAVAKAHNVALQTVIDALVADGMSELQAQVANGSITQAQADAMKSEVTQRATDQVDNSFAGGRGPGGPGGFGHDEAVSDTSVLAKAIGISETDLKTALASGQTVAAVAKAHSVDVQTVIDALVADSKSELAAAVKAGTLTQAQADAMQANLVQHATDQVNGTFGGPRP